MSHPLIRGKLPRLLGREEVLLQNGNRYSFFRVQTNHFPYSGADNENNWELCDKFYQELLKEKSNPRLKDNRKGIIVKGKEFYILNTFPTR